MEFDLVADDAPSSPTQMLALLQVFTQTDLYSLLRDSGYAPPLEVLLEMFEAAGLPSSAKEKWMTAVSGAVPPEVREQAMLEVISQLSPEVREAVEADLQAQEAVQ